MAAIAGTRTHDTRSQGLGASSTDFPGTLARSWLGSGSAGFELASVWDAGLTGSGFTHSATVPAPDIHVFERDDRENELPPAS